MRFEHVEVGEVRLHCAMAGEGPLVVLVHGFPEFWFSWRHQLEALSGEFRLVAPDLRGYNLSDAPPGVASYDADQVAADLAGLVEALGEERATLVGHDWGGVIAWRAAALFPERVSRLAVLAGPHPSAMARRLRTSLRQCLRSWYILFFQLPWIPEWLVLRDPRGFVEGAMRGRAVVKEAFPDEVLDRFAEALSRPGRIQAMVNYYRAAFRGMLFGPRRRLPRIQCPTLVLWGERDFALGTGLARDSARYVDGPAAVEVLAETGHWVQQERPEQVNRRLLEFLRS